MALSADPTYGENTDAGVSVRSDEAVFVANAYEHRIDGDREETSGERQTTENWAGR